MIKYTVCVFYYYNNTFYGYDGIKWKNVIPSRVEICIAFSKHIMATNLKGHTARVMSYIAMHVHIQVPISANTDEMAAMMAELSGATVLEGNNYDYIVQVLKLLRIVTCIFNEASYEFQFVSHLFLYNSKIYKNTDLDGASTVW